MLTCQELCEITKITTLNILDIFFQYNALNIALGFNENGPKDLFKMRLLPMIRAQLSKQLFFFIMNEVKKTES